MIIVIEFSEYESEQELNQALCDRGAPIDPFYCDYNIHHLKVLSPFWGEIAGGLKTYHICPSAGFEPGDICCFWWGSEYASSSVVVIALITGVDEVADHRGTPIVGGEGLVALSFRRVASPFTKPFRWLDLVRRGCWPEIFVSWPWVWPPYGSNGFSRIGFFGLHWVWRSPSPAPWDKDCCLSFEGGAGEG